MKLKDTTRRSKFFRYTTDFLTSDPEMAPVMFTSLAVIYTGAVSREEFIALAGRVYDNALELSTELDEELLLEPEIN